jgi:hypothetical protein
MEVDGYRRSEDGFGIMTPNHGGGRYLSLDCMLWRRVSARWIMAFSCSVYCATWEGILAGRLHILTDFTFLFLL